MDEKKKPKNIYMTDKTKDRLSRIAAEKHMHLGDLIDYMLDVIENKNENNIDELLTLQKQNKKLLSVIETHTELTTILFNELARTMQLEIKDESDSLGVTQAKKIVQERQENRRIQAMNSAKYSQLVVTNE
ncbi:hypothetical protein D3Z35_15000 [Enterococcus faecalis]|uniref:hypothetical protein n=1 Tax=Enterococcus faecalis TaxID=1351 RepID=UPI00080C53CE|nr:hypothetical protein [Enterococcus faecalis]ANU71588.1 hypothetical protein A4V06_00215 [Enterococcus faecalis]ASU26397.1 hypothetical protein ADH73_10180 [Enterococcus faecalis]MCO8259152.1 hypothetical protein [Enterococcus faecalis]MCP8907228.1 hypothetical protein [Enterococcus faecalis]MCP8910194.1 hypothetical protein [Enterococcus faecalis]